jgi:hypothetical protein
MTARNRRKLLFHCKTAISRRRQARAYPISRPRRQAGATRPTGRQTPAYMPWVDPYADGPLPAGCLGNVLIRSLASIFPASVYALAHGGWPRWFPGHGFQTTERPINGPWGLSEYLASWIDQSHHLLLILQVLASGQHGCTACGLFTHRGNFAPRAMAAISAIAALSNQGMILR